MEEESLQEVHSVFCSYKSDTERGWDLNLGTSILASGESPPASDYKVAIRDENNCTLGGKLRTVRYKNATNQWPPLSKTKVLGLILVGSTAKGVGRPPEPPLQPNPPICLFVVFFSCCHVQLFCNPMDCSPPGSSVHGISQAKILEWVVISFSRGIFLTQGLNPGFQHCRQILYHLSHQGSPTDQGT